MSIAALMTACSSEEPAMVNGGDDKLVPIYFSADALTDIRSRVELDKVVPDMLTFAVYQDGAYLGSGEYVNGTYTSQGLSLRSDVSKTTDGFSLALYVPKDKLTVWKVRFLAQKAVSGKGKIALDGSTGTLTCAESRGMNDASFDHFMGEASASWKEGGDNQTAVVLKRPLMRVDIVGDYDELFPDREATYKSACYSYPITLRVGDSGGSSYFTNSWAFDSNNISLKSLTNSISQASPKKMTVNGEELDCFATAYFYAPATANAWKYATSSAVKSAPSRVYWQVRTPYFKPGATDDSKYLTVDQGIPTWKANSHVIIKVNKKNGVTFTVLIKEDYNDETVITQ